MIAPPFEVFTLGDPTGFPGDEVGDLLTGGSPSLVVPHRKAVNQAAAGTVVQCRQEVFVAVGNTAGPRRLGTVRSMSAHIGSLSGVA
jgi:hypothetical protein